MQRSVIVNKKFEKKKIIVTKKQKPLKNLVFYLIKEIFKIFHIFTFIHFMQHPAIVNKKS